jgi:hypothetical protein
MPTIRPQARTLRRDWRCGATPSLGIAWLLLLMTLGCTTSNQSTSNQTEPFCINYNTELAEDQDVAASLQASLGDLLGAITHGELDPRHITIAHQQRHAFFTNALRSLGPANPTKQPPLVLKSYSPDGVNYLITVAFFRATDPHPQIDKILEFYAYPAENGFRFQCPFDHYQPLPEFAIGDVTFHASTPLHQARAEQFVAFKKQFEDLMHATPTALDYFRFDSLDELLKAHGMLYDAAKCNSLAKDLGFLDGDGQLFLTGTGDERYIFGYVRDFLRRQCDRSDELYAPFVNGMAAYYGGYALSGDNMKTLKRQLRDKLTAEPEFDFLQAFQSGRRSSIQRHFTYYVICALLCEEVVTRCGFDQALVLAQSGRNGEQFFANLHSILGVGEHGLHELVKRLIHD